MSYIVYFFISWMLCFNISEVRPLEISLVAQNLSIELDKLFEEATSYSQLEQEYSSIVTGGEVKLLNGTEIVENISRALSEDFALLTHIIKDTVEQVDQVYLKHINTSCCSAECVHVDEVNFDPIVCNKLCSNVTEYFQSQVPSLLHENETAVNFDLELEYSRAFGSEVNLSSSAIHVPLDIYEQDPMIQCFVEWSDDLTSIFQQNQFNFTHQLTQSVTFQYFGSNTGLLRTYPATDWHYINPCYRCPSPPQDTFNVHRRPWYRNTVSGNKMAIILFDLSGSMTGFRFLLAKLTVQQLLKSLTQDDYFYIIRVADSNKTTPLDCFNGVTRATPENVLVMNELIQNLTIDDTGGKADFTRAVKMALDVFSVSSECHKTMIVITDYDADSAILDEPFNSDMEIRIFPFIVGRSRGTLIYNRIDQLERLTCEFGGRVYFVEDYSQVLQAITMLFDDLRELSLSSHENEKVFWNHYRGLRGDLVLTGSSPLFSNQTVFVGVVGVDVNLNSIAELFQIWNLGEFAYGFMMDNNGQLLVHPQIDKQYIKSLPSDGLINLEVSYFEDGIFNESNDFELIRQAMLNRESGHQTLEKWLPLQREKHYRLKNVTYFYAPVEGTPYSIALVLPDEDTEIYDYSNLVHGGNITEKLRSDDIQFQIHLDDRPYCSNGVFAGDPTVNPVTFFEEELLSNINNGVSSANCNPLLIDPLLVDWNISIALDKQLRKARFYPKMRDPDESTLNVFFQYVSGLTYCICAEMKDDDRAEDVCLYCPNKTQPFIHLTMEDTSENNLLFYTIDSTVFIIKRFVTNDNSSTGLLGTAVQDHSELLNSLSTQLEYSTDVVSYLIDSSGYIVVTSSVEENLIGQRFVAVEPAVFEDMVDNGVYLKGMMRGYELRPCNFTLTMNTTGCIGSSAYSIYQGLMVSLVKWMVWALNGGMIVAFKYIILSILGSLQSFTGWSFIAVASVTPSHSSTSCPVNLCLQEVVFYQLNNQFVPTVRRHVNCSATNTDEEMWYEAVKVNNTNLVLVVVSSNCNSNNTTDYDHHYDYSQPIQCPCDCDRRPGALEKKCDVFRREPVNEFCHVNNTNQLCSSSHSNYRTTSCFIFTFIVSLSIL